MTTKGTKWTTPRPEPKKQVHGRVKAETHKKLMQLTEKLVKNGSISSQSEFVSHCIEFALAEYENGNDFIAK